MKYLLLVALFLTGCGTLRTTTFSVDGRLQPYFQYFMEEAGYRNKHINSSELIMRFAPMSHGVLAHCYFDEETRFVGIVPYKVSIPVVEFSEAYFNGALEVQRREVVSHELGHCLLHRGHDDRLEPYTGYPVSLMYPFSIAYHSPLYYSVHESNYMDELFGVQSSRAASKLIDYSITADGCSEESK